MAHNSKIRNIAPSGRSKFIDWISDRTLLYSIVIFALIITVLLWHQSQLQRRQIESAALMEAEHYTDIMERFRTLYSSEVVEVVRKQGITVAHDYEEHKHNGNAIPLPATLSVRIGNELTENGVGGQTALYSGYPFPNRESEWNERDRFAKNAWDALVVNKVDAFYRFELRGGKKWLRYATADVMRASCIQCHNTHPQTPKSDWVVGDVRGVLEVSLPLDAAVISAKGSNRESLLVTAGVVGSALASLVILIGHMRRMSIKLDRRVDERTIQLNASNKELAQQAHELEKSNITLAEFNRYAVGREIRMIELKQEINGLATAVGEQERYDINPENRKKN